MTPGNEKARDLDALDRWHTVGEAARIAGVSGPAISQAIRLAGLPAVRRFGATLIHSDDLADYIARRAGR